jgi:hypothetical protein
MCDSSEDEKSGVVGSLSHVPVRVHVDDGVQTFLVRAREPVIEFAIDVISEHMTSIITSSSLLFNGSLDMDRFLTSLEYVASVCPWLMGTFDVRDDGQIYVVPRAVADGSSVGPGFFECEYDNRKDRYSQYQSNQVADVLPQYVHEKLMRPDLCFQSVQDLPVCAFRVTQYASQFTIGYRLNHVFFDQGAIVYLFKFLSNIYNNGGTAATMSNPVFSPKIDIIPSDTPHIASREEFDARPPLPFSFTNEPKDLSLAPVHEVIVSINADKIVECRASNPALARLSTNDLVNGLLMKALVRFNEASKPDQGLRLLFARNMRRPLGLDDSIIGDYVHLECLQSKIDRAKSMSITEFALQNREVVSQPASAEQFVDEVVWLRDLKTYLGKFDVGAFWADRHTALVTNWTSFDYDRICFDGNSALEVLMPKHTMLFKVAMWTAVLQRWTGNGTEKVIAVNSAFEELIQAVRECVRDDADGIFECN